MTSITLDQVEIGAVVSYADARTGIVGSRDLAVGDTFQAVEAIGTRETGRDLLQVLSTFVVTEVGAFTAGPQAGARWVRGRCIDSTLAGGVEARERSGSANPLFTIGEVA